jgi:hypothetical protein
MAMISIYCDDSGTHPESRVAAVAGYISNMGQWELFVKEWGRVLKEYKVSQMHRAELENGHGEFKGWSSQKRITFVKKLHSIMRRRTRVAIGSAVFKKDFEEIIPEEFRKFCGGVYGWCAHECIVHAKRWAEKCQRDYSGNFQWVFEAGTKGHGQVKKMFDGVMITQKTLENWHIGGISFQSKAVVPLQAADVISYEVYKHVENQLLDGGKNRDVRISMLDLYREQDENYLKYWSRERLLDWVESARFEGKPIKEFKMKRR